MQKRKMIYQILALVSASGIIVSFLLGPGTVAPRLTVYTLLSGSALLCTEYLTLRESALLKGRAVDVKWVLVTLVVLIVSLIPQALYFFIATFLWFLALPTFGVLAVILLFKLLRIQKQKDLQD
jgi:hypothetical protein